MDDRRFDAFAKSLASGTNRRKLLKGLLGFGGIAVAGGTLLEPETQAARRPTPTPKPPTCPGKQIPCAVGCCCPPGLQNCGPDCCTETSVPAPQPGHSECCDNACCFGTCYGEELCCPTNNRSSGEFPVPPTHKLCEGQFGSACCEWDQYCCDGMCSDVPCTDAGCALCDGPEDCCFINDVFVGCVDLSVEGACCTADTCEEFNDFDNCRVGACIDFECTQLASCTASQYCCDRECQDEPCESNSCSACDAADLDCCYNNDVFAGCYDSAAEGSCCTAAQCEYLNDFEDCLFGTCTSFVCEQIAMCGSDERCCSGDCYGGGGPCPESCEDASDCASLICCGGLCCNEGQHCCGGCTDLECALPKTCSSDFDCGGDIVCCVGDCCTAGQSCVTDSNNNSYCE